MSISARLLELSADQFAWLSAPHCDAEVIDRFLASTGAAPPRLSAEILATKRVQAGAGVSYGHTFRAPASTTLALISIGYGHGIPRKAGNRASVSGGREQQRMPIVGRVAMDVLVIDAGDAPMAAGESVTFFGAPARGEIALTEWCASVGEHPFSVLASLDARVGRQVTP